eukprot:CAMPEP_0197447056 /NCGR_PEP_ID=MMETSP1175-20131217/11794_1 /TAXON_ID=1003142 /ORGANISM="Triceratium dubium, Strain CCMP147" /LENGTH=623 /DNA_ID=CAMNT_0042978239 /DNA_START=166 /DNA_END=2033 /DNA_ORIENTATION=-
MRIVLQVCQQQQQQQQREQEAQSHSSGHSAEASGIEEKTSTEDAGKPFPSNKSPSPPPASDEERKRAPSSSSAGGPVDASEAPAAKKPYKAHNKKRGRKSPSPNPAAASPPTFSARAAGFEASDAVGVATAAASSSKKAPPAKQDGPTPSSECESQPLTSACASGHGRKRKHPNHHHAHAVGDKAKAGLDQKKKAKKPAPPQPQPQGQPHKQGHDRKVGAVAGLERKKAPLFPSSSSPPPSDRPQQHRKMGGGEKYRSAREREAELDGGGGKVGGGRRRSGGRADDVVVNDGDDPAADDPAEVGPEEIGGSINVVQYREDDEGRPEAEEGDENDDPAAVARGTIGRRTHDAAASSVASSSSSSSSSTAQRRRRRPGSFGIGVESTSSSAAAAAVPAAPAPSSYHASRPDFEEALKERGLEMVEQEGDGNCLFRAVSLQVYGDANNHGEVRRRCLDFMARDEPHFSKFIIDEPFREYIQRKRRDGVHGNNPEIQAISELYNRPVEIFVPDNGAKPINIFHAEYKTSDAPIRLSYHDGNHYNAVVDPLLPTAGLGLGLPGLEPGLADRLQLEKAKEESEIELAAAEASRDDMDRALQESRASVERMYDKQKALALSDLEATDFEL